MDSLNFCFAVNKVSSKNNYQALGPDKNEESDRHLLTLRFHDREVVFLQFRHKMIVSLKIVRRKSYYCKSSFNSTKTLLQIIIQFDKVFESYI